ncbi:MAG: hypothetical protein LBG97_01945 [Coriobacteriales bacterium]|jgi:hypothetical protein|nr:hypothetical protein [Coriobacteriales bacterium]
MDNQNEELIASPTIKNLAWYCVWVALLCVCVVFGVLTRCSYSDAALDYKNLLDMRYQYMAVQNLNVQENTDFNSPLDLNADVTDIIEQSPIIVKCEFDGDRKYLYQAFLSQVRVTQVLKGDSSLNGKTIPVFEPVKITKSMDPNGTESSVTNDNGTGFVGIDYHKYMMPSGMYNCGYTMLKAGDSYLLFLSAKEYHPAEDRTGKATEYVFVEHPYAKLNLSTTVGAKDYVLPKSPYMTLAQSLEYEIVLSNLSDADTYFSKKDKILLTLNS